MLIDKARKFRRLATTVIRRSWEEVNGRPGETTLEAVFATLRERLEQPPALPFKPLPAATQAARERCASALDEVGKIIPGEQRVYFETSRERYLAMLCLLEPHIRQGAAVLDIGCSPGHVAMALALLGCRVQGIDLNEHYLPKYPSPEWIERLGIRSVDIERDGLPLPDAAYDLVLFTEVLEHIAIRRPWELVAEFRRVLKPGGVFLLSTPNFANVSQLLALAGGTNVMWAPEIFYGSTDRHNREYVPAELVKLIGEKFPHASYYWMNADHNWNGATAAAASDLSRRAERAGSNHHIFYNTMLALARAD